MKKVFKPTEETNDMAQNYLNMLEELGYPVVKDNRLDMEEFNDELMECVLFQEEYEDMAQVYLNELENIGLLKEIINHLTLEEFNDVLIQIMPQEEEIINRLNSKKKPRPMFSEQQKEVS